jgi:hypothetical protein
MCGRKVEKMPRETVKIEGFVDATALIRAGVYVLVWRGEVVYVGKARGDMLAKLTGLRANERPSWLPRIQFDQILLREVHPDRLESVRAELIAEFEPKHNADKLIRASAMVAPLVRRV